MIKYIIMIIIPWILTITDFCILYDKYKEAKYENFRLRISESCLQEDLNEKNRRMQEIIDHKEQLIKRLKDDKRRNK